MIARSLEYQVACGSLAILPGLTHLALGGKIPYLYVQTCRQFQKLICVTFPFWGYCLSFLRYPMAGRAFLLLTSSPVRTVLPTDGRQSDIPT